MFPSRYFCNRYFAPRYFPKVGAEPAPITDVVTASAFEPGEEWMRKHHYPRTSCHYGSRHHHGFSLLSWLRPAGAPSWQP